MTVHPHICTSGKPQYRNHHCHHDCVRKILGKPLLGRRVSDVVRQHGISTAFHICVHTWSQRWIMLFISSSDTSVPMEISAAAFTSSSISSGRMSETSEDAKFLLSPAGDRWKYACSGGKIKHGPAMLKGWGNSRDSRKTGVGQQLNSTHSILTSGPHHWNPFWFYYLLIATPSKPSYHDIEAQCLMLPKPSQEPSSPRC